MPCISLVVQRMKGDSATGNGGCVLPAATLVMTGGSAMTLVQASQD